MRSAVSERSTLWRVTLKLVAAGFLLLSMGDLALPALCQEDSGVLLQSVSSELIATSKTLPSPEPPATHDCFCCCSHVLAQPFTIGVEATRLVSSPVVVDVAEPPAPSAPLLFRPPRLA